MATDEFRQGAEMVGKAAEAKFNNIGNEINDLKGKFSEYANEQAVINQAIIDRSDDHEERMRQLEENRYFVRSSRRGIEDLDPVQQDRLVGWLQKLVREFNSRGFQVNRNQQKFLSNLLLFLGITDEVAEVSDLSMLANFGNSDVHEIVYKIFLIFTYLHDNSFDALKDLNDISGLFKLSDQNKIDIQKLLAEERIPLLGLDGLVNMYDPSRALNSFKPQTLYASVREIHSHPLLKMDAAEDVKKLYIQGFALLSGGSSFCEEQYNYLKSLANVLQCVSGLEGIEQLCQAPQKFPMRAWCAALNSEELKYSWLLDGIMLLCQLPEISRDTVKADILEEGAKSLRIMQAKDFISPAIDLCLVQSAPALYESIQKISQKTGGWGHILEYRNLNLQGAFADISQRLNSSLGDITSLLAKQISLGWVDFNISSYCDLGDFDEGFFEKMKTKAARIAVEAGRSSQEKKLKEYYNEAQSFVETLGAEFRDANSVLNTFGIEEFYPKNKMIEPDLDNSARNENWYDDYSDFLNKIGDTLNSYSDTICDLTAQLEMLEKGEYHTSLLERRKAEREEKKEKEKADREALKCREISTDEGKYKVSMSWKEIDDIPFELDSIDKIGYAGGNWFIMADKQPYCLDSNLSWHKINDFPWTYVSDVFQVNGHIVLTTGYASNNEMLISTDCQNWKKIALPTDKRVLGILYFQDKYVLYTKKEESYTYTEKGLIFDSEESGRYDSTIAWKSSLLDGDWESWNEASYTSEGMVLASNLACNSNVIIGGFRYDWCFKLNKKKSSDNYRVAYFTGSRWKTPTWPNDTNVSGKFYFLKNNGIYIDTFRPVLLSPNGYEWRTVDGMTPSREGGLCGNVFMTIPDSKGQSLISLDGQSITQLTIAEEGDWNKFSFGDGKVLGIYAKSAHESSLLLGTLHVMRQ